jgi:hypothetical protein
MQCHNGSNKNNYAGPGLENPHPFGTADNLTCTICHGGNPDGTDRATSHVPPPPQIGDRQFQAGQNTANRLAYFNRLTLSGMDKFPDYTVNGQTYSALDYLQFIAPSDLRVLDQVRSCGQCHAGTVDAVSQSLLASEAGILSGAMYAAGIDNAAGNTDYQDTASEYGFRAKSDSDFDPAVFGSVDAIAEFPVFSGRNDSSPSAIRNNPAYDASNLDDDVDPVTGRAIAGSELANLYHEQIAFTCGDCHLGSSGANNRYGDFRGSGCAACHMRYSLSGRSTSNDPNLDRLEPYDPDNIDEPELPHVRRHLIYSAAKTLPTGEQIGGIDDYSCAGCHQGSNRTVMQYWGIRLDQNQDVRRQTQYPANPASHRTTSGDRRLFDPDLPIYDRNGILIDTGNDTFNGRNRNQYLLEEDYDDDGRDDTPPDVHYDAGMGCIDCHGAVDLHGGNPGEGKLVSRMEHGVAIRCESCHGPVSGYAQTQSGQAYDGQTRDVVVDAKGNLISHVVRESDGNFYLYSRLTGQRHFVPQTYDSVVNTGRLNPITQQPLYSVKASYAMGRFDGNDLTGLGPQQTQNLGIPTDFSHGDNMDCASCHSSWTNTCMGCHLKGEYRGGNEFSNITGEEIVFREDEAEFVYQSPVFFQLTVNSKNKITQGSPNTKVFFQWEDRNNTLSKFFTFSDRQGNGAAALGHNAIMAHSIRGKVSSTKEGPRYCVACHLTTEALTNYGAEYDTFRAIMADQTQYDQLDFTQLRQHFGQNTGNQMNSPLWVHMVTGLGTGLFLFDENGCPINPLDQSNQRYGCFADPGVQNVTVSPASLFDPATMLSRIKYNLDRIVVDSGAPMSSGNHPLIPPFQLTDLREGANNPNMAGPLGQRLIRRLTNPDPLIGIVLDSWFDANGDLQGDADQYAK